MIRRRKISDPTFGTLTFDRTFGLFGAGFWDGEVFFKPTAAKVKVRIRAGKDGPSKDQRIFLADLESRYLELAEKIRGIVVNTPLIYWGPDFFGKLAPELRWADFALDSIGIPSFTKAAAEWSLSFRYIPMGDTYSVHFENWTPIYGKLDD